ncbi:protein DETOXIFICATION 40-like [Neltuma alba]|uniref:protein DETOXIFICATION 40-like n=1 Tax=Neltuma alba TaxID=207710 RepID=UPI0010A598CC|nr:protein DETOXIFICATION 40-like [Prosopis alba]
MKLYVVLYGNGCLCSPFHVKRIDHGVSDISTSAIFVFPISLTPSPRNDIIRHHTSLVPTSQTRLLHRVEAPFSPRCSRRLRLHCQLRHVHVHSHLLRPPRQFRACRRLPRQQRHPTLCLWPHVGYGKCSGNTVRTIIWSSPVRDASIYHLQRASIVLTLIGLFVSVVYIFAKPVLIFLGQSPKVASAAAVLVHGLIPQIFAYAINFPIQKFLQAQSVVFPSAFISTATLIVHLFLNWLIVYRLGLGLLGASLVLSLSWWIIVIAQFVYIVKSSRFKHTWGGFSLQAFSGLPEFFKLSAASAVMLCLETWYFQILVLLAGLLDNPELALDSLSICVRVGNEVGAGHPKSAAFSVAAVTLISFSISVVAAIAVLALRDVISYAFTEGEAVAAAVSDLCPLLAITLLLNGIQPVLSGVAVGCGWQLSFGCIYQRGMLLRSCVPLGLVLGFYFNIGAKYIVRTYFSVDQHLKLIQ